MQLPKIGTIIEIERILGCEKFSVNHLRSGEIYNVRKAVENWKTPTLEELFGSE